MPTLIKNGRVIDPANKIDAVLDLMLEGRKIAKVAKKIKAAGVKIIDAKNKIILPGLVDMHAHLREPGREDKETVFSATQAALKGGITTLLAMPNTFPAMDTAKNIALLKEIIKKSAWANVLIAGAITKERLGQELTDIAVLKKAGVAAITDDGNSIDNAQLFLEALKKARENKVLVISHCEDKALSAKGVVNYGLTSTRMGLRGISKESEYTRVARDIELVAQIKTQLHIAHVSCKESLRIIASAKKKGLALTCETAPHYFALSEEAVLNYDPNLKMNPPLRSDEDKQAIKEGLKNGIIDVIASDHAPHTESEKDIEFEAAEFGVVGLETELAVAITELVQPGILDWKTLAEKLSWQPARILGINKGSLSVGADADLIVVNADKEWVVEKRDFLSRSKNSAFLGRRLKGRVEYTFLAGKIVYQAE